MEYLASVKLFLEGKKTYLVGAAMVLTGLANQDWNLVLQGLSVITIRAGITKV